MPKTFFTTREAAEFLAFAPRTLIRYRTTGAGPVFHRFGGQIRYSRADLEEWAADRRVGRST